MTSALVMKQAPGMYSSFQMSRAGYIQCGYGRCGTYGGHVVNLSSVMEPPMFHCCARFLMRYTVAALVLFLASAFRARLCAAVLVAFLFVESSKSYGERLFAGHVRWGFVFGRFSMVSFGDLLCPSRAGPLVIQQRGIASSTPCEHFRGVAVAAVNGIPSSAGPPRRLRVA